jgi:hypothetical protein
MANRAATTLFRRAFAVAGAHGWDSAPRDRNRLYHAAMALGSDPTPWVVERFTDPGSYGTLGALREATWIFASLPDPAPVVAAARAHADPGGLLPVERRQAWSLWGRLLSGTGDAAGASEMHEALTDDVLADPCPLREWLGHVHTIASQGGDPSRLEAAARARFATVPSDEVFALVLDLSQRGQIDLLVALSQQATLSPRDRWHTMVALADADRVADAAALLPGLPDEEIDIHVDLLARLGEAGHARLAGLLPGAEDWKRLDILEALARTADPPEAARWARQALQVLDRMSPADFVFRAKAATAASCAGLPEAEALLGSLIADFGARGPDDQYREQDTMLRELDPLGEGVLRLLLEVSAHPERILGRLGMALPPPTDPVEAVRVWAQWLRTSADPRSAPSPCPIPDPATAAATVAAALPLHLQGSDEPSYKIAFREEAVSVLAYVDAIDEAAALADTLRRKLGSSRVGKQSQVAAFGRVAAGAARLGRLDVAKAYADKLESKAAAWDTHQPTVLEAWLCIAEGLARWARGPARPGAAPTVG